MKFIKRLLIFLLIILLTGCGTDDSPVSSFSSSRYGVFSLDLVVANKVIRDGGTTVIQVVVRNAEGEVINNEDKAVLFSCDAQGAVFEDAKCDIVNGRASTTMTWRDESERGAPFQGRISATSHGAIAWVELTFVTKTF